MLSIRRWRHWVSTKRRQTQIAVHGLPALKRSALANLAWHAGLTGLFALMMLRAGATNILALKIGAAFLLVPSAWWLAGSVIQRQTLVICRNRSAEPNQALEPTASAE
jgi:hypothetical protein